MQTPQPLARLAGRRASRRAERLVRRRHVDLGRTMRRPLSLSAGAVTTGSGDVVRMPAAPSLSCAFSRL